MRGLNRTLNRQQELAVDRVEVERVAEAQCESGDGGFCVVMGAVEAPVDESLHA